MVGSVFCVIPTTPVATLSDAALLDELVQCAQLRRRVDARVAELAAEVAVRSSHELGYAGLAQSQGARTPVALVQQTTGLSKPEANALLRVGSAPKYLAPFSAEVHGVAKVDAVRGGLGEPTESVTEDDLLVAAIRVADESVDMTVEQAASHARAVRDELDAANVARREQEQRDARFLSISKRTDGMFTVRGLLDPESAAVLTAATDAIIAPRRGGPRFVDPAQAEQQRKWEVEDLRTVPQMRLDAVIDLIRVAIATEQGTVLTGGKGRVSIHVTKESLETGAGVGYFEGNPDAVSLATVARFTCDTDTVLIDFDRGFAIDVGRDQRLFTKKQRTAISARDGGCLFPGCDRPPAWTEVHHINQWATDHGRTDTADGVLLCRHHHMLIHNNGWHITRTGTTYYLHTPDSEVLQLESKSPLYRTHRGGGTPPPGQHQAPRTARPPATPEPPRELQPTG